MSDPTELEGTSPGMPRWVKASLAIALVFVLLLVIGQVTGIGGEHGPGRHSGGGGHRARLHQP
jgi:hypothetical protein